jgi:prepilin-type N-terminal cleavage/methylation domain-containing protein
MQASLERLRQRREEGREGGFTLIELLIVIVILAILAAIVVFAVQNLTGSSAQASCRADFKTVESATEAYKAQVGHYPNAGDAQTVPANAPKDVSGSGVIDLMTAQGTNGPWLKDLPYNSGHYQIVVSNDAAGTISVYQTGGATFAADKQLPTTGTPTNSAADCSAVS